MLWFPLSNHFYFFISWWLLYRSCDEQPRNTDESFLWQMDWQPTSQGNLIVNVPIPFYCPHVTEKAVPILLLKACFSTRTWISSHQRYVFGYSLFSVLYAMFHFIPWPLNMHEVLPFGMKPLSLPSQAALVVEITLISLRNKVDFSHSFSVFPFPFIQKSITFKYVLHHTVKLRLLTPKMSLSSLLDFSNLAVWGNISYSKQHFSPYLSI